MDNFYLVFNYNVFLERRIVMNLDKTITLRDVLHLKFGMQEDVENWKLQASEDFCNGFMEAIQVVEEFINKELK